MSTCRFTTEFNGLAPYLRTFAYKLTQDPQHAQDLFQDTAFLAFKNRDKFRTGSNFKAWLATIMRNSFINGIRKKQRRMEVADYSSEQYLINSGNRTVRNDAESTLTLEELKGILNQLIPEQRTPFLLHYQGFKYEEISQELELPLGTVKSRIFQARKQLKKLLKAYYQAESSQEIAA